MSGEWSRRWDVASVALCTFLAACVLLQVLR